MRSRIPIFLVFAALVLAGCGQGVAPRGDDGEGATAVMDAVAGLRAAGTANFTATVVRTQSDGDPEHWAYEGSYEHDGGPWGETVHTTMDVTMPAPFEGGTFEKWDLGDTTVWPNYARAPEEGQPPPKRWRAYPKTSFLERQPSPLSTFELLEGATAARDEGPETKDGVQLTRWMVTVPADRVFELLGLGERPEFAIDCAAGMPLTVWTDGEGRLRRFQLAIENYHVGKVDAEFAFTDLGAPLDKDAIPPQEDDISGWGSAGLAPRPRTDIPDPCPTTDEVPTGVDRSDCAPLPDEDFKLLDRIGRLAPGGQGEASFLFKELAPVHDAFDVPDGVTVHSVWTEYPTNGGATVASWSAQIPPDFDPNDQAEMVALMKAAQGQRPGGHTLDPPADVKLRTITVRGTWADIATAASNCRYWTGNF